MARMRGGSIGRGGSSMTSKGRKGQKSSMQSQLNEFQGLMGRGKGVMGERGGNGRGKASLMMDDNSTIQQIGAQSLNSEALVDRGSATFMQRKRRSRIERRKDVAASSIASSPTPPVNHDGLQADIEVNSMKRKKGQRGSYKGMKLHKKTNGGKKKLEVIIPDNISQALGTNARDLANHCGYTVRTTAPVDARSWEEVLESYGEIMLKQVEERFQLHSSDPNTFKFQEYCEETMHRLFRSWRSRLSKIYRSYETDEEGMKHKPKGLSIEQWRSCLALFAAPEFAQKSQTNSQNRLKSKCRHTTGNLTFVEFEELLETFNRLVTATNLKLKEMVDETSKEGATMMTQEEMLLKVFQPRSGYVRGKGNGYKGSSKRAAIAAEHHRQQQQTISYLKKEVEDLKAEGLRREEESKRAYENLRTELLLMLAARDNESSTSALLYEDVEDWTSDPII